MGKKCRKCGQIFDDSLCSRCAQYMRLEIKDLLLEDYYDNKGDLVKDVFIGVPEKLANFFASKHPKLSSKQLRDVHLQILKARNIAMLKGFNRARPILWECSNHIRYQAGRGLVSREFEFFVKHHIDLAEKSEKMLEGFYKHIDAVVCYFKEKLNR